jgi:hypothetical protein
MRSSSAQRGVTDLLDNVHCGIFAHAVNAIDTESNIRLKQAKSRQKAECGRSRLSMQARAAGLALDWALSIIATAMEKRCISLFTGTQCDKQTLMPRWL